MAKSSTVISREYRQRHKDKGLCTSCSNRAVRGYTYCADCLLKMSVRYRTRYSSDLQWAERERQRAKATRQKRISEHRCTRCGSPLQEDEVRDCNACRASWNQPKTAIGKKGVYCGAYYTGTTE